MRCCRNFSCIEWVCVCKSFLCHGNKSSYYACSPPTFHIFLFEMFEIHSVMFNFFLLVLFLCSHDFELPRRESNVKHLLLLNVHFDLATSKVTIWLPNHLGQSHWTRFILKSSSTRSVNFIALSCCHMHCTNTNAGAAAYLYNVHGCMRCNHILLHPLKYLFDWHSFTFWNSIAIQLLFCHHKIIPQNFLFILWLARKENSINHKNIEAFFHFHLQRSQILQCVFMSWIMLVQWNECAFCNCYEKKMKCLDFSAIHPWHEWKHLNVIFCNCACEMFKHFQWLVCNVGNFQHS